VMAFDVAATHSALQHGQTRDAQWQVSLAWRPQTAQGARMSECGSAAGKASGIERVRGSRRSARNASIALSAGLSLTFCRL